jgi:hypothetical protein
MNVVVQLGSKHASVLQDGNVVNSGERPQDFSFARNVLKVTMQTDEYESLFYENRQGYPRGKWNFNI